MAEFLVRTTAIPLLNLKFCKIPRCEDIIDKKRQGWYNEDKKGKTRFGTVWYSSIKGGA